MAADKFGASKPDLGANQEGHQPGDYLFIPVLARQAAMIVAEKNLDPTGSGEVLRTTLADVPSPDELTCRRLLALLRPGDRRSDVQVGGPDVIS